MSANASYSTFESAEIRFFLQLHKAGYLKAVLSGKERNKKIQYVSISVALYLSAKALKPNLCV